MGEERGEKQKTPKITQGIWPEQLEEQEGEGCNSKFHSIKRCHVSAEYKHLEFNGQHWVEDGDFRVNATDGIDI